MACFHDTFFADNTIIIITTLIFLRGYEEVELKSLLLSYSREIANGLEYLSSRGYIHRDVAARNILLSKDGVSKVYILNSPHNNNYYAGQAS